MVYFLYKTTNLINHKTYIGIHQTENIDDGYIGSGSCFLRAVKKYGKENFKREIIEFCSTYNELLEKEKKYVNEDWIKNESNYNLKTGGQSSGLLSEESKKKISNTLKAKYAKGELVPRYVVPYIATDKQKEQISKTLKNKYASGELTPNNVGVEPWNKGKKGVQEAWNKGKTIGPMSDAQKEKISKTLKEYFKENKHPNKGKKPWNKGEKGVQEAWNKGLKTNKIKCPHCEKEVDIANGKRWHFDNCRLKDAYAASNAADKKC
jgi:hypothetical protein